MSKLYDFKGTPIKYQVNIPYNKKHNYQRFGTQPARKNTTLWHQCTTKILMSQLSYTTSQVNKALRCWKNESRS